MSRSRLLAVVAAMLLVAGACGGDAPTADAPPADAPTADAARATTTTAGEGGATGETGRVIEVVIVRGEVDGGSRRERVALGSEVTIRFTSDVADEIHVHTYDRTVALVPGKTATVTFVADIPGIHEVELHERHRKVLDLEVG